MKESMRTLTVSLTPQQAALIQSAVDAGSYASNSEIVREGLRLWQQQQELRAFEIGRLKRAYDEGMASGPGRVVDADTLLQDFKRKRAKRG
jgi:antitoxin ParD1/3/4